MTDFTVSQVSGRDTEFGCDRIFADRGFQIVDEQKRLWLRSGSIASALTYARAAALEHLKVIGVAATNATAVAAFDVATDGAGRFVVAYGSTSTLLYSINGGQSWATVNHNLGGVQAVSVTYSISLALWIVAGNDATSYSVATQTQTNVGTAWTARTGSSHGSATANQTRVRAGANSIVMVAGGTGNASYSTNGTAWANKAISSGGGIPRIATIGTNYVQISSSGSTSIQRSTDNGNTFSGVGLPFNCNNVLALGVKFYAFASNGAVAESADFGATWKSLGVTINFPGLSFLSQNITSDGTRLMVPVCVTSGDYYAIAYSTDGINWLLRSISSKFANASTPIAVGDGTKTVMVPGAGTTTAISYSANFNIADNVGYSQVCSSSPVAGSAVMVTYTWIAQL